MVADGRGIIFVAYYLINKKIQTMAIKWKIDPAHSEVQFKVKHLMISTVTGYFKEFDLEFETEDEDFGTAKNIRFTAAINSITTNAEQRDEHLRSADFFKADEHPQLIFEGQQYDNKQDPGSLKGNLTIRGVTKPLTLNVEFGGSVVDAYGQSKAAFVVDGKISRKEFGLTWNAVTESGSIVVSDEVKIHAEVQVIKQ